MSNRQWESVWEFNTANLRIVAEVTDCEDDPADSFEFPEDIESVRSGKVAWFDARVRVLDSEDNELGSDYLGCCAYDQPADLFRHHATYSAELNKLRREHDYHLTAAHRNRVANRMEGAARYARIAGKIRNEIAEVKKVLANNAALEPPVNYCEYGPDMVRQACQVARKTLRRMQSIRVR